MAKRPLTRAEASGWRETSRHEDVMAFLSELGGRGDPRFTLGRFGASAEGRELPLVTLSTRPPARAREDGAPVVLIIGGIHAGEVEGKEAILMLLGDLLDGAHAGLLEPLVVVVVPLFNPDGNDRIDPRNRALDLGRLEGQIGPQGGVGTRVNAAGINLNRDYMRQESVEMRLLQAGVWLPWSPDLTIDCHSTNGSVHRFALTYDTPHTVASGRPEPIQLMRRELLPEITRRVRAGSGRETFFYGNFVEDEGGEGEGWMTYTHHPRFGSNYRGLTGRMDLLLETYSYQPFEERVGATYQFLVETLRLAGERAPDIARVVRESRTPPAEIAVRYRLEPDDAPARILTRRPRALDGEAALVTIPHLSRFTAAESVRRPWGYAVPEPVARLLERHGLPARPAAGEEARVEVATISGIEHAGSRRILEAPGESLLASSLAPPATRRLPDGAWIVPTDHPLGAIATYLCEPASDDGLIASKLLAEPAAGSEWPAWRIVEPPA